MLKHSSQPSNSCPVLLRLAANETVENPACPSTLLSKVGYNHRMNRRHTTQVHPSVKSSDHPIRFYASNIPFFPSYSYSSCLLELNHPQPPGSRLSFENPWSDTPLVRVGKNWFHPWERCVHISFFFFFFFFFFLFIYFFFYTFPSPFSIISSVYYSCIPPSWSCWSQLCVGNDTFAFFSWSKTLQISGGDGLSLTSCRGATPDV